MSNNTVVIPPSATPTTPSPIASFVHAAVTDAATKYGLTPHDVREMYSMILGLESKESAAKQNLSAETVRQRRKMIYRKLGVDNVGKAVAKVLGLDKVVP